MATAPVTAFLSPVFKVRPAPSAPAARGHGAAPLRPGRTLVTALSPSVTPDQLPYLRLLRSHDLLRSFGHARRHGRALGTRGAHPCGPSFGLPDGLNVLVLHSELQEHSDTCAPVCVSLVASFSSRPPGWGLQEHL